MTTKEYLSQVHHLDELMNIRLRELHYWRAKSCSLAGSSFESHNNPNHATEAPYARCLEKIEEVEALVAKQVVQLNHLKKEIGARIDLLEDNDERMLLRYRYLDGLSWNEIAVLFNVSIRTVHRMHGAALKHFSASSKSRHTVSLEVPSYL